MNMHHQICVSYVVCRDIRRKQQLQPKVLLYFSIIARFRRMYRNMEYAKHLKWHVDERTFDRILRNPIDSPQWWKLIMITLILAKNQET